MAGARPGRARSDALVWCHPDRVQHDGLSRRRDALARSPLAVAAGGHDDLLRLRHLRRSGGGHAAQRPSLPVGHHRGDDRPDAAGRRDLQPPGRARRGAVHGLVRLPQFSRRVRQFPHAVDDAARLALCRDPGLGGVDRALHGRAARQRLAQRLCRPEPCRGAVRAVTQNGLIVSLMAVLVLTFGYLGVPVAFSLIAGVVIGTLFTPVSLPSIIAQLFNGIDAEPLMAVPFFLLVGELMTSANVVVRIANLSQALVGHVRGGLAQVVTVFSMFFSGMSGSSSADVAVLSRTMAQPMAQEGYEAAFVAALIAAEHHGGGLWRDRQCLNRGVVSRRHRSRPDGRPRADGLLLFLWTGGVSAAALVILEFRRGDE